MARILIVDDDELLCDIVARTLAPVGHVVAAVCDGDDALDALWEHGPDVAILDCALPGKTGLTILREIRQSAMFGKLPVLILTARRSAWHAKLAIDAGANDYVRKPFEAAELIGKIDKLLAESTAMRPSATVLDEARIADLHATVGDAQADTLLAMMERDIADRIKTIVAALDKGDATTAIMQAHALRGAADGIGALDLARHCHCIERGEQTDGAPIAACAIATIDAIARTRATPPAQLMTSSA